MDLKDIFQKNVANIRSKLPQISNMPKLSKLKSRKIFNTHCYSKENISSLQNPVPSATIVDRTPMKISTISSLVDDNKSQHYRSASEQYVGASTSSIDAKATNGEHSQHVRFSEKLTKTYKELSEFKFSHIFGKKTIVRRTEIQLDMYKGSFEDDQKQNPRKMSEQSQFDIEVITLPTARLSVPHIVERRPYFSDEYSPINRNISPTFISYPAPQNNDEIISVPTPPLTRRKVILPEESEINKSRLWKSKESKINKSTESEISKDTSSAKNSLRSITGSRKSTGMWKVQRPILIKAPPENLNEAKPESRPSSSVKNMLKKMSSRNSIDENKNDEKSFSQSNLWQRSIKRKVVPDKNENETENEDSTNTKTTYDSSTLKIKITNILDKSSNKVKHLISKETENTNTTDKEKDDSVEENSEKLKSMEEIEAMGYGKKNLKYIEKWRVRRRREIRRTKPFPIDSDTETKRKKIRGMWNIQRPIRIKANLDENDSKSDSKTMQTQMKDFRNVVIKAWRTKITPQPSVDSISNEPETYKTERNNFKLKEPFGKTPSARDVRIFEEKDEDNISPDLSVRLQSKSGDIVYMVSERTSLTDSYKTSADNLNYDNEPSAVNQPWKALSMKANEYSSSDSEESIEKLVPNIDYFTANKNEPTIIISNKPVQPVTHSPSPTSCIHLSVPLPLALLTPPLPIKFASSSKEISQLAMVPTNASKHLENQILKKCSNISELSTYTDCLTNSETSTIASKCGHKRKFSMNLNDSDCWTASNSFDRRHSFAVLNISDINEDVELSKSNSTDTENTLRKWRSVDIFKDQEKETVFEDFDDQLKNVPVVGINENFINNDFQDADEFKSLEYVSLLDETSSSEPATMNYETKLDLLNEIGFERIPKIENNLSSTLSKLELSHSLENIPQAIINLSPTLDTPPPPLPLELPPPLCMESFPLLDIHPILAPIPITNIYRSNSPENDYKSSASSTNSSIIMSPEPTGIPIQKIKVSRPVVKTESLRRQFSDECEAKDLRNLNVNKLITQFESTEVNHIPEKQPITNTTSNVSKLIEDNNNNNYNNIKINQFTASEISKIKLEKSPLKINQTKYESLLNTNISKSTNRIIEKNIKSVEPPPINPRKKLQTKQIKKPTNKDEEIFYSIDNYDDESQLYSLGGHSIIKELYTIDL